MNRKQRRAAAREGKAEDRAGPDDVWINPAEDHSRLTVGSVFEASFPREHEQQLRAGQPFDIITNVGRHVSVRARTADIRPDGRVYAMVEILSLTDPAAGDA